MLRYVGLVLVFLLMKPNSPRAAPARATPVRLTIDCGSSEEQAPSRGLFRSKSPEPRRNLQVSDNICNFISKSLPKTVKDGRFILRDQEQDQIGHETDPIPIGVAPPKSFIPKLEKRLTLPKVKVPKFQVPKLSIREDQKPPPKLGAAMNFHTFRPEEVSSSERMEKIKKAVQKMLHVVKILGRIDEYISERMKIIVEKIAQTFE